jgi:hypothetical protein
MAKHLAAVSAKAMTATKQAAEVMDLSYHQPPTAHNGAE